MEPFEGVRLKAAMRFGDGCPSFNQELPITIARSPFVPIKSMLRSRSPPLRACNGLRLFKVVQLENCTAYVHRRSGRSGGFVVEPLLCPSPSFELLRDFSIGSHYVRLPAMVEDASTIAAVKAQIEPESTESIFFMKLWDAMIYVSPALSRWKVGDLRLSVDRREAELRAYCSSVDSCELLMSTLRSEPVNFWKQVQWTGLFLLNDECEYEVDRPRFAYRMKDTPTAGFHGNRDALLVMQSLSNKTVSRGDRNFVIFLQRTCRNSDFQRYWREYVAGFGDEHNYWIGLEFLHRLTSRQMQDAALRVEITLWNDTEWFAEYSNFYVGNSSTSYTMTYGSFVRAQSSLVYDALAYSNGQKFSTRDVDNDGYSGSHCSVNWGGYSGWWHQSGCSLANPNGIYHVGNTANTAYAVWRFVEGFMALEEIRMMVQV